MPQRLHQRCADAAGRAENAIVSGVLDHIDNGAHAPAFLAQPLGPGAVISISDEALDLSPILSFKRMT